MKEPMLSENVMWSREDIQTEINILKILIDVFVCVSPSLNHCKFQEYSHKDCNEAVLCGPHTSKPSHAQCIPKDTEPCVSSKPLPEQKVKTYFVKDL
jgi:hypothetical protein